MSFKEEAVFENKYIEFFNEHYCLTSEIWDCVDKLYPLRNQKKFLWNDLCNGDLTLSEDELSNMDSKQAISYVESKIKIYYFLLEKNYTSALKYIKQLIESHGLIAEIVYWQLIAATELGNNYVLEEVNSLTKEYNDRNDSDIRIKYPKDENELQFVSKKNKKLLAAGNYQKCSWE